jgi:hypothetical protein
MQRLAGRHDKAQAPSNQVSMNLVVRPLRPPRQHGFAYSMWRQGETGRFWVVRQGSLVRDWHWFGPIQPSDQDLKRLRHQLGF